MVELMQENVILLVIALLIGIAVAWYIFAASRKTTIEREEKPDEAAPARRNQALIDSAPVASPETRVAPAAPDPEPVIAVQEPPPAPAAPGQPTAPSVAPAAADDLTRIKGVGPKLAALLSELGVSSFAQVAAWDDAEIDRIDAQLGRFEGRIRRDNWVEQAGLLQSGDQAAYVEKFGQI